MSMTNGLMTAEAYFRTPDDYERSELVRGVVVPLKIPDFQHGLICGNICYLLGHYLQTHDEGWAACGTGIITRRNPDTVRGGDLSFYSYERLPRGELPKGYSEAVPNLVFEVRSPSDRWSEIHEKIGEYLTAGVELVCVLVPERASAHVFYPDRPGEILQGDEELTLPAPLDEFRQPVSAFFAVS